MNIFNKKFITLEYLFYSDIFLSQGSAAYGSSWEYKAERLSPHTFFHQKKGNIVKTFIKMEQ
jgi:hypothetical protein